MDFFSYRIAVLVMTSTFLVTANGFLQAFYCFLVLLLLQLLLHTHTVLPAPLLLLLQLLNKASRLHSLVPWAVNCSSVELQKR